MPKYAFFDFDGTLISTDSFQILAKEALKKQPWRLFFLLIFSPVFLATYFFKLDKTCAKSCLLWSITVFRGLKGSLYFLKNTIVKNEKKIWFPQAISEFEKLRNDGVEIVVISASGQIWIRALLALKYKYFRMIIGTKLGFRFGGVVLKSKNCYKEEKINRIEQILGNEIIWQSAWSDHVADLPMLKKSATRYIVSPKKKHLKNFDQQLSPNYTLLTWTVPK